MWPRKDGERQCYVGLDVSLRQTSICVSCKVQTSKLTVPAVVRELDFCREQFA